MSKSDLHLAAQYSYGPYTVVAVAADQIRVDFETEDGGRASAILIIEHANQFARDLSRAVRDAMRME
jgi:hypothetical protein